MYFYEPTFERDNVDRALACIHSFVLLCEIVYFVRDKSTFVFMYIEFRSLSSLFISNEKNVFIYKFRLVLLDKELCRTKKLL